MIFLRLFFTFLKKRKEIAVNFIVSANTDIGIKIFIRIYPNNIIFASFNFIYLLLDI